MMNSGTWPRLTGACLLVAMTAGVSPAAAQQGCGGGSPGREAFLSTLVASVAMYSVKSMIGFLFKADSSQAGAALAGAMPCPPMAMGAAGPGPQRLSAGIAFEVYRAGPGGDQRAGNDSPVFHTGERAVVKFVTNLPGIVDAYNTNGSGETSKVGEWKVGGGGGVRLGPWQFTGAPGDEVLLLQFYPCNPQSGQMAANETMNLVGSSRPDAVARLASCGGYTARAMAPLNESMVLTTDGDTSYGVTDLPMASGMGQDAGMGAGQTAGKPMSISIRFRHRAG